MSAIKFGESLSKFMIPIALLEIKSHLARFESGNSSVKKGCVYCEQINASLKVIARGFGCFIKVS